MPHEVLGAGWWQREMLGGAVTSLGDDLRLVGSSGWEKTEMLSSVFSCCQPTEQVSHAGEAHSSLSPP